MKKILIPVLCAAGLLLAGCAAENNPVTVSPSASPTGTPTTSPSASPMNTGMPDVQLPVTSPGTMADGVISGTGMATAAGVTSAAQGKRVNDEIEDELEKLSEVTDAQVVVAGKRAAVALEFDRQYQGGIDERIRTMVKERIGSVVTGVTEISITDDNALYERLESLGDRFDGDVDLSEIETELKNIITGIEA